MDLEERDKFPSKSKIETAFKFDTEYSADSVEWCPHAPFQNHFVCGTYQLNGDVKTGEKRLGRILLFSVGLENGLTLQQSLNTPAILDQKWCLNKINETSYLAVVNSVKQVNIYKLNSNPVELVFVTNYEISDDESETLVLSVDWSTGKYSSDTPLIVCSDSKGNIHRLKFCNDTLILENSWAAHEYEAWIAAFYYWDVNITFTGGDDSLFLKFDQRCGIEPVVKNRTHQAGVTCIHSNRLEEYTVASGSYDSYLRIWDTRMLKLPKSDLKLPGTLWRVKWDPFESSFVLVASMWGGAHVVERRNENLTVVDSYYDHNNIVYGADWSYLNENVLDFRKNSRKLIGTCSFYDHLLCISTLDLS